MKATFNIKTRVLNVSGKEIYSLRLRLKVSEAGDWWHSLRCKKTGKPLYDINVYHDNFVRDDREGAEWNNPKNWRAQVCSLVKNGKFLESAGDYKRLPMKVKRK